MLTTAPYLYVRRPSPTTAEFTVTTRPPMTLPLRLVLLALLLLRVLVVAAALSLLYAKWILWISASTSTSASNSLPIQPSPSPSSTLLFFPKSSTLNLNLNLNLDLKSHLPTPPTFFLAFASLTPPHFLLPLSLAAIFAALTARAHTTERLLVLRGLGIQTDSGGGGSLSSSASAASARFIATDRIRDVLINEAFRGFEVRYYLVVVVEGEDDVVVVFPRLLPCRRVVEAVWRGVRECLYEPDGVAATDGKI